MEDQMFSGMAEATRLTREGKVLEATALIQRTLGVPSPHVTPVMTPPPADTVDDAYRVVEDLGTAGRQESEPTGIGPAIPRAGSASPSRDEAGQFLVGTYTNAAGARSYKLYIPSGYRGQEVPLLVMLHGCTQTADDFAVGTRMNLVAEEQTFIVVYPEQARRANGGRCWNWFEASHQTRDGGEPSIIAETTRHIMAGYRIDPAQVYVAGMSAGGAMAAVMAATYPDLFAAVGIHSGVAPGAARTLQEAFRAMQGDNAGKPPERTRESRESGARAVPVIVFHGDRDKTVNPRNADRVMKQWATGGSAEGELRVTTYPCQVPGGYAYTRTMYRDASDEVVMEKWIVHEAGHAWSGGDSDGTFADPRGPNASIEMVRFFREHPRHRRS